MKIFKKFFLIFCIVLFISFYSFADDIDYENFEDFEFSETSTFSSQEPLTNSKHIIVLDRKTLSVLYEKDAYSKTAMASTTKIMTCILALEKLSLNTNITVSKNAATIHGSVLGLNTNDTITIHDLLYGLMLRSGNDCAICLAEAVSGTTENFAILMNEKSQELNLKNTHFVTSNGLDDENHYTTAYDLAILTDYALKNETFRKIVSTKNCNIFINGTSKNITNTNELLGNTEGVYGVKTGFTFNAGRCLVSSCKRNNMDIIVVVLGADTKKDRTKDSYNLINYVFKNFSYINVFPTIQEAFNKYLAYNSKKFILEKTSTFPILELEELSNYEFPLKLDGNLKFNTKIHTINNFSSQTKKDSKIGILYLYNNNNLICKTNIILKNALTPNSWHYYFRKIFKNLF